MESFPDLTILIGLNYYDQNDSLVERVQFFGRVVAASEEGIRVISPEGREYRIPPDFRAFLDAPRGEYRCLIVDQTVVDPDLLTSWKIRLPADPTKDQQEWMPNYSPHFQPIVPPEWEFTYRYDGDFLKDLIKMKGETFIGKRVLVGIAYHELEEGEQKISGQEQFHGTITRVSYEEGIVITPSDGREYALPPDITMLQPAAKGEYKLSTGETVTDPDIISLWTFQKPADEELSDE